MIPGLTIAPEFVTPELEFALLFEVEGELAERKRLHRPRAPQDSRSEVMRWGAPIYPGGIVHPDLPVWCHVLLSRLPMPRPPESLTLNVWEPGDRLDPHVDRGGEVVCVLNLLGSSSIAFHRGRVEIHHVPRRALLRMSGEARWEWEHAIFPADERRISLVFRNTQ